MLLNEMRASRRRSFAKLNNFNNWTKYWDRRLLDMQFIFNEKKIVENGKITLNEDGFIHNSIHNNIFRSIPLKYSRIAFRVWYFFF